MKPCAIIAPMRRIMGARVHIKLASEIAANVFVIC